MNTLAHIPPPKGFNHQAPHPWGFLFVGGWVELGYKRNRKECKTNELSFKKVFGALINIIIRLGTKSGGINLSLS